MISYTAGITAMTFGNGSLTSPLKLNPSNQRALSTYTKDCIDNMIRLADCLVEILHKGNTEIPQLRLQPLI
jgi:hypothetical protein